MISLRWAIGFLINMTKHGKDTISSAAKEVVEGYTAELSIPTPDTQQSTVIAMVGLIAAGRTTTGKMIAEQINAVFVRGNDIRMRLRAKGAGYDEIRKIVEHIAEWVTARGGSVVVDTDFADKEKRAAMEDAVHATGARVVYVRCTAEADTHFQRIRYADYKSASNIYTVASTSSSAPDKEVDVRLREFWRRTPRHYRWLDEGGGKWKLREMGFVHRTFDTTESVSEEEIREFCNGL